MEPADFVPRWNAYIARLEMPGKFPLIRFPAINAPISSASARFLTEAGLPDGAGLRFEASASFLKSVPDVIGKPQDWDVSSRERLSRYLWLGDDEGGNPVCLDMADRERVVLLNHERFWDPLQRGFFINSGVAQLAECILIFQEMIEAYQEEYEGELYEGNVPAALVEQTLSKMHRVDAGVVTEGGYWPESLEDI